MADRHEVVELRLLRAFEVLAEELNFGRAAERLHMSQPALSAQLRLLERKLGFALFERSTRRVSVTNAGASLLGPARLLLAESSRFSEIVGRMRGRPRRSLVFGAALYTLGIRERQELLEAFFARHPDTPFRVIPIWQREVARALLRNQADLALMLGVPVPLAEWEAEPTAEVIFPAVLPRMVLRQERVTLLVPKESPLAAFDEIPMLALDGVAVAMLGGTHGAAILRPVRAALGAANARLVVPPEPHGIGVERYGRQFRMPAVSLGYFEAGGADDPDMTSRPVAGLTLMTQLALVRASGRPTEASDLFWDDARARFPKAETHTGD